MILSQYKQGSCQSRKATSAEHGGNTLTSMLIIQAFSLLLGEPICCWHHGKEECSDTHHSISPGVQNYPFTDVANCVL